MGVKEGGVWKRRGEEKEGFGEGAACTFATAMASSSLQSRISTRPCWSRCNKLGQQLVTTSKLAVSSDT